MVMRCRALARLASADKVEVGCWTCVIVGVPTYMPHITCQRNLLDVAGGDYTRHVEGHVEN